MHLKQKHAQHLVMYRIGEFYELFFEDAETVSQELNLSLTKRGKYNGRDVPMCGIPAHVKDIYLSKLVKRNHKIALYEQSHDEDAKSYARYLRQIYTPGTLTDDTMLAQQYNNFLVSIYMSAIDQIGFAIVDISTGEVIVQQITLDQLHSLVEHWNPSELLVDSTFDTHLLPLKWRTKTTVRAFSSDINNFEQVLTSVYMEDYQSMLSHTEHLKHLEKLALQELFKYLKFTQCSHAVYLKSPQQVNDRSYLYVHQSARDSLELIKSLSGRKEAGLLHMINQTITSIGSRRMIQLLNAPLVDQELIEQRLEQVELFLNCFEQTQTIRKIFSKVHDLERLLVRIYTNQEKRVDFVNLLQTIRAIRELNTVLPVKYLAKYADLYQKIEHIYEILDQIITDDVDHILKLNTNKEYKALLDESMALERAMLDLENSYQDSIASSVKIKHIQGLDYVIEIPTRHAGKASFDLQCVQTLSNCKRFTTHKLTEMNIHSKQLQMSTKQMELDLLKRLGQTMSSFKETFVKICNFIAELDIYTAFAYVSKKYNYTRPKLTYEKILHIEQGRHPVMISMYDQFVPNDCDMSAQRTMLLTGPNMSGKSTYMKQTAQIIILAQMGCFVPASKSVIGLTDGIYTRLGSYDDITEHKSTFMCEMSEMSYIFKNATERSFLIIDEIGRGTSPEEGYAIASSILNYLDKKLKARVIFATHFHKLAQIYNGEMMCKYMLTEDAHNLQINYKYKLTDGVSHCSYGLAVAKQAGLPNEVIEYAQKMSVCE